MIITKTNEESVNDVALYKDIKSFFTLPTAYEDWTNYRRTLTDYVISNSNETPLPLQFSQHMDEDSFLPTLAIVGAGACNDLDLGELLDHFSKITLIDYDENALQTALSTYELTDCPYIECSITSLNGLKDTHYESFCNDLQNYLLFHETNFTMEQFEQYALEQLELRLKEVTYYEIPLEPHSYDYVCCFGVHSQLQAMFSYIYKAFADNLTKSWAESPSTVNNEPITDQCDHRNAIHNRLHQENNTFIPRFHDALLACAKHTLFVGCEKKRTNMDGAIEGAYQGLLDIKSRNLNIVERNVTWNFLPQNDIVYEMEILKIDIHTNKSTFNAS